MNKAISDIVQAIDTADVRLATVGAIPLIEIVVAALGPIIDDLDAEQGPANYNEDNFEAGWHHALYELKVKLGLVGTE